MKPGRNLKQRLLAGNPTLWGAGSAAPVSSPGWMLGFLLPGLLEAPSILCCALGPNSQCTSFGKQTSVGTQDKSGML